MKALVIDDEELARRRVVNLLEEVPEVEVIGECANGKTAIKQINSQNPDLIFLDINMKDLNGFEVLQNVTTTPKPIVIFVTAYDSYAIRAFEVDAFDFLLKPFKDQRFFRTIEKVLKMTHREADENFEKRVKALFQIFSGTSAQQTSIRIPVKQGNKTTLIHPKDILYIIASGYYGEIYTKEKKYVLRESLNRLMETLNPESFLRIHRSSIVNIDQIKELVHSEYSSIDVRMTDGKILHVSQSHRKELMDKLGIT